MYILPIIEPTFNPIDCRDILYEYPPAVVKFFVSVMKIYVPLKKRFLRS